MTKWLKCDVLIITEVKVTEENQRGQSEYSDFNSFINNYIKQLIKSHALSVEIRLKYRGNLCTTV